jgi:hypothetical protein
MAAKIRLWRALTIALCSMFLYLPLVSTSIYGLLQRLHRDPHAFLPDLYRPAMGLTYSSSMSSSGAGAVASWPRPLRLIRGHPPRRARSSDALDLASRTRAPTGVELPRPCNGRARGPRRGGGSVQGRSRTASTAGGASASVLARTTGRQRDRMLGEA